MYRFIDRPVERLEHHDRFLLTAMRIWVGAVRLGRCSCGALKPAFASRGGDAALRDFGIAMATLDCEGTRRLSFGVTDWPLVLEDEARLLALFAAARTSPFNAVRRMASGLVAENAAGRLVQAAIYLGDAVNDETPETPR